MKPLRLEMEAFGPYKDNTVIDFEKLSSTGVYLISGNTGSGKSYIFDGILYALFKNVSGSVRKENSIRCDFADPKALTKVIFDFEVKREKWHIERIIQLRSNGNLNPKSEVLTGPHGEIYDRRDAFDAKIEELLGLSKKDFITVAMIAQGEFRKAMASSTAERTELFRNIFDTDIYAKIQAELLRREQQLDSDLKTDRSEMLRYLKSVYVDDESAYASELNSAIEKGLIDEETILLLNNISKDQQEHLDEYRRHNKELNEQFKFQTKRLQELETAEKLKNEITQHEIQIAQNTIELEKLRSITETFDEVIQKERSYSTEKESLLSELKEHEELSKLSRAVETKRSEYESLLTDFNELNLSIDTNKTLLLDIENYLQVNEGCEVTLTQKLADRDSLTHKLEEHSTNLRAFNNIEDAHRALNTYDIKLNEENNKRAVLENNKAKLQATLIEIQEAIDTDKDNVKQKEVIDLRIESLKKDFAIKSKELRALYDLSDHIAGLKGKQSDIILRLNEKINEVQAQEHIANELYKRYLQGQASLLGEELKDNTPCPVCGSLDHPHIAQSDGSTPSKDEVNQALDKRNSLLKDQGKIQTQLDVVTSECSSLQKQYDEKLCEYKGIESLENEVDVLQSALERCNEDLAKIDVYEIRLAENQKNLQITEKNLEDIIARLAAIDELISQVETKKATLLGSIKQQETALSNVDRAFELLEAERIQGAIQSLKSEILDLEHLVSNVKAKREDLQVVKNTLSLEVSKKEEIDVKKNAVYVELSKYESLLEEGKSRLSTRDIDSILIRISQLEESIEQSEAMRKDTQDRFQYLHGIVERDKGLLHDKTQRLGSIEPGDLEEVKRINTALSTEIDDQQAQIDALAETRARNASTIERIQERYETSEKANREYAKVKTVSDIANGKLKGHKVKFETYLQGMYLDLVLNEANKRFAKMTSGRYKLVRSKRTGGQGAAGLDIDVLDTYSKKTRSSSTLSGGESFKASLSLALGLSDVARMHAGGISVDCMFIDEGFGTLDDESRRSAVETLCELSQGNKSVGIISHVAELKEFIDNQVLVSSDNSGSHVEVIV